MLNIDNQFVYLISLIPFSIIWLAIFLKRKDLRKEILFTSFLIGVLSVATSYFWWTKDWWRPITITHTIVGIEDFIMGFTSGGIMSVIYDYFLGKTYAKSTVRHGKYAPYLLLVFMGGATTLLFLYLGITSFWSSFITMALVILFIDYLRKDLIFDSLISGTAMFVVSITFYAVILLASNTWIDITYLDGLSGVRIWNVPVEEFVFWFLAGMWVGPFYEYALGKKLKRLQ